MTEKELSQAKKAAKIRLMKGTNGAQPAGGWREAWQGATITLHRGEVTTGQTLGDSKYLYFSILVTGIDPQGRTFSAFINAEMVGSGWYATDDDLSYTVLEDHHGVVTLKQQWKNLATQRWVDTPVSGETRWTVDHIDWE